MLARFNPFHLFLLVPTHARPPPSARVSSHVAGSPLCPAIRARFHIRSGTSMPTSSSPRDSTFAVSSQSASRERRSSSVAAFSTGHAW